MMRPNLLPWRQRRRRQQLRRFLGALAASGVGAALALALLGHHIAAGVESRRHANHELTAAIAALDARLAAVDQLRGEREELDRHATTLLGLSAARAAAAQTLGGLAEAAVPGVRYTRIARKDGVVAIVGVAESHGRVSALTRNLHGARGFESPVLKAITGADGGESDSGARTVAFELSFHESNPQ